MLRGEARLLLDEIDPEDPPSRPYRMARATILREHETTVAEGDRTALVAAATMFASEVKKHDPHFSFRLPHRPDAGLIADLCASQLVVDSSARQAALEELDPRTRVQRVLRLLALQHGAMLRDGDSPLN